VSDAQSRQDFLEANWTLVSGLLDRVSEDDRVVVLADTNDESGMTFARFIGVYGQDASTDGSAWACHYSRNMLAALLYASWPSATETISYLRDGEGFMYAVLVIAHGGVQLCVERQTGEVPA